MRDAISEGLYANGATAVDASVKDVGLESGRCQVFAGLRYCINPARCFADETVIQGVLIVPMLMSHKSRSGGSLRITMGCWN